MALVGESNERPKWAPDPTSPSMRFDEERRKREEEEARKEEERKQRAIAAAQAMAAHRAEEQRTTNQPTRVSTDVSLTGPRVDTGAPSLSASSNYQGPIAAPEQPAEASAVSERPQERDWRRGYQAPPTAGAGIGFTSPVPSGNAGYDPVKDWWQNDPGRRLAGEMFNERVEGMSNAMQGFALDSKGKTIQGPVGQMAAWSDALGAPRLINALQYGADIVRGIPLPNGLSFGQAVGAAGDAFGSAGQAAADAKTVAATQQDLSTPGGYLGAVGQNAKILFDSLGDVAQYWQDEADAMRTGVIASPEQLDRSTPDQVARARQLARFTGYSGAEAAAKTFDEYLDNPVLGQEKIDQAAQMRERAYTLPAGPIQDNALFEAAKVGAEGLRLRDKSPLEIYNENSVWWKELGADLIFDPLNVIGLIGDVGKATGLLTSDLTPMGRRLAKAAEVTSMPENAPMGVSTTNAVNQLLKNIGEGVKLATSKAKTDSYWNWTTIQNVLSVVHTKDDYITVLGELVANPQRLAEQGIETARLTSPDAMLQDANGFFRFGWASIKNSEFVKASKALQIPGFMEAVQNLPSLRMRAPGELVDKNQFMGDINGLLGRFAGWNNKVSAMDGVPYGAVAARMVPGTTPGTMAVEFVDAAKQVIKRTTDMGSQEAALGLQNAERAIKKGIEYQRNPLVMIGDFERRFFSNTAINSVVSSITTNVLGGMGVGLINLEDARIFQATAKHASHLASKLGGLFPDQRLGQALDVPTPAGMDITSAGYWQNSGLLKVLSLGLGEVGRKVRNFTEEAMGVRLYGTGFLQEEERGYGELGKRIAQGIGRWVQDPQLAKGYTDQLVQAMVSGTRADVARVAQSIARGAPAISLRTLSKSFGEVLDDAQVLEIDTLLRDVTDATLPQVRQRIGDIIEEKVSDTLTWIATGTALPKRYYWTDANRVRERAEMLQNLDTGLRTGRLTQQAYDAMRPLIQEADRLAVEADEGLLGFLQMEYGRPDTIPAVYGAWTQIQNITEGLHATQAQLAADVERGLQTVMQATGQPTKMPWEMTLQEWADSVRGGKMYQAQGPQPAGLTEMAMGEMTGYPVNDIAAFYLGQQRRDLLTASTDPKIWRVLPSDLGGYSQADLAAAHSRYLADALFEGRRVPANVLAPYPNLASLPPITRNDSPEMVARNLWTTRGPSERAFLLSAPKLSRLNAYLGADWDDLPYDATQQILANVQRHLDATAHLANAIPQPASGTLGDLLKSEKARLWTTYHEAYTQAARAAGAAKKQVVNQLQAALANGTYMVTNPNPLDAAGIQRIFGVLGVNETTVRNLQDMGIAFANDIDANLFNQMKDGQRAVTEKYTGYMMAALQYNPKTGSFDEFMSAIHDVGKWESAATSALNRAFAPISAAQAAGTQATAAQWAAARAASKEWVNTYRRVWERLQTGAVRIIQSGIYEEAAAPLRFNIPAAPNINFRLLGPSKKGYWQVVNEATGKWTEWADNLVPQAAKDALPAVRAEAQRLLDEQIGYLARQAGVQGIGQPDIDAMINAIQANPRGAIYQQMRQTVAEHIANPRPTVVVPDHMEDYIVQTLYAAGHALQDILPTIVQLKNKGGFGALGPEFINFINGEILPRMQNVLAGADRAGKAARSVSLVDYISGYWPDALLSTLSPYHFWFSRMAKNSLEQLITNPAISANISRLYNRVFWENQENDVPNRNMYQIPGLRIETDDAYIGFDLPFARWLPITPLLVQNGWADPDRANTAYEYLQEAQEEGGWAGSRKGMLGSTILGAEVMKRFGFGVYPWIDAALAFSAGKRIESNLGTIGPIPRMVGWSSIKFANWLRDNGATEAGNLVDTVGSTMRPFYEPYLVGRQASFNANRGLMTDVEAQNVQDVGMQEFFPGTEPLPEQLPNAADLYRGVEEQVSTDYLLRQFLAWLIPTRVGSTYKGEMELREAGQLKTDMGYEPGMNLGGSKTAQNMMYDQVPGLSARGSQYAVTGEIAPQVPDPNAVRPGARAAQGAYYDKKDEIDARYEAIIDAEYGKHPEWDTPGTGTARYEILNPIWEQKKAEMEALNAQYPTVQEMERQPANAPSKLSGTNPTEAVGILLTTIVQQAKATFKALDPGPRPENASRSDSAAWQDKKNQYDAALTAEVNRLMQQPGIGQLVPGRELPGAGIQPPYQSSPYAPQMREPISQISQTTNVTETGYNPPTESATIENPWSAEMTAAEQQYGLPPGLLSHIAQAESGFDPEAKSGAGAVGLMQFMPATWSDAEKALGLTDINDPAQQVQAAAWYLDWLSKQLPPGKNGLDWQLAAYNLGIGKVSKLNSLDQLPGDTAGYVNAIVSGVGGTPEVQPDPAAGSPGSPYTPGGPQTQAFGNVSDYYTSKGFAGHEGVDYGMVEGTPVTAAAAGTVVFAGEAPPNNAAYGNYIIVRHGDGKETWYAHLSGWDVKAGDTVTAGQQIGESGNTGVSDGPHLHFAVRDPDATGDPMKGFVDPATYLAGMEQGLPTPVGINLAAPAPTQGQPAPAPGNNIQFPKTADQLISGAGDQYKGPLQLQSEAALAQGRLAQDVGLMQAYPEYVGLRAEWDRTNDEDRAAFRLAHPEITAVNLLLWNKDVWTEVEQTFGQGAVMKYARRPTYESGQRATYYHKDPTAFLVGAWLNGRPEPKKEEGQQDTDFSYDRGGDYAKAEELFGAGIWGKVRSYWAIDPADKTARNQFYKDNPDYKAWNDWWYALMPDQKPTTYAGYYLGGGSGYGSYEQQDIPGQAKQSWRRDYQSPEVPKFPDGGGIGSDWRKWLDVGSRGWRG